MLVNASIEEYFAVGINNICPTLRIYLTHFKATKNFQVEELLILICSKFMDIFPSVLK